MDSSAQATQPTAAAAPERTLPELPGYDLIDEIGRGGMGVVYEAYQQSTGRRVAVKFLPDAGLASETARRRFEREVEIVARLSHPSIVSVLDSGVQQQRYFYVMDYIDGVPLDAYARRQLASVDPAGTETPAPSPLPGISTGARRRRTRRSGIERDSDIRNVLDLLAAICDAIDHAHQRGVLHRDLKPSNILIDPDGRPHVLDFGLAKSLPPETADPGRVTLSEPGQVIGTLAYMPPEQAAGRLDLISVRSDVYSLGVIAYELITGKLPISVEGPLGDVLTRISRQEPLRPSAICRGLAADLEVVLLKAIDKDPARRYATVAELVSDLRRWLNDEPVTARPTSAFYQFRKFARRNKVLVGGAATTVFALAAGFVVSLVLYFRAESARAQTEKVAEFQGRMLSEVDAEAMGLGMIRHLREQVKAGLAREFVGDWPNRHKRTTEEVEQALKGFDEAVGLGYSVDVARKVMDQFVLGRAVEAVQKDFSDEPLVEARLRHAIGTAYWSLGLFDAAEQQVRMALDIRRRQLGEHPDVAASLNDLAELLRIKGDHAAAEPLVREALNMRRNLLGDEHADVARSMDNLAVWHRDKGDLDVAEPLFREALTVRRKVLGNEHQDVATSLNNLGWLLQAKGDYAAAEPLCREALVLYRKLLGDEHQYVAASLNNLAPLLHAKGEYDAAELLLREALAIYRKALGNEHAAVATTLNNLAMWLRYKGDYAAAEPLLREALTIWRKSLGDEHPQVALGLNNLALVLQGLSDFTAAEPLFRESLALRRNRLGDEHPDVAAGLSTLAGVLHARGDSTAAEPLVRQALVILTKRLPAGHPSIAASQTVLGEILRALGRYSEVESLLLGAWQALQNNPQAQQPLQHQTLQRLVSLYDAWHAAEPDSGYDARASEWRAKLTEWQATTQAAHGP